MLLPLASGRLIHLAALPDLDWRDDMAAAASRICRFAGQVAYSVAEHECRGADTILAEAVRHRLDAAETRRAAEQALAFLLHDQHECLIGDMTASFKDICRGIAGGAFDGLMAAAIEPIDAAIYGQAGLAWPLDRDTAAVVATVDRRMGLEECRRFWPALDFEYAAGDLAPIPAAAWPAEQPARPWSPARASAEWLSRFQRLREGSAP